MIEYSSVCMAILISVSNRVRNADVGLQGQLMEDPWQLQLPIEHCGFKVCIFEGGELGDDALSSCPAVKTIG